VRTDRRLPDPQSARLLQQEFTQVQMRASTHRLGFIHSRRDFRTYFISLAGNRYTSMHYDISGVDTHMLRKQRNTTRKYSTCGAAPPGVKQRDRSLLGGKQVDRDAVGDGDEEEGTGSARGMPIRPLDERPSLGERAVPEHAVAMYLMGEDPPGTLRECCPKPAPAPEHFADRLTRPKAQVKRRARFIPAPGHPGDDTEPFPPPRNLPQRHRAWDRNLVSRQHARSVRRAPAGACRSVRSHARSGRCC
jgi:hypothetical protein